MGIYSMGFVHAQDRLWQLEKMRRVTKGRLAEAFGEKMLPLDTYLRTIGFNRFAKAAFDKQD